VLGRGAMSVRLMMESKVHLGRCLIRWLQLMKLKNESIQKTGSEMMERWELQTSVTT